MNNSCLHCGASPTIDAHIFPKAAIRAFRNRGPDQYTMAVLHDRAIKARAQNGIYDPDILCADCDCRVGNLDKWFVENVEAIHESSIGLGSYETTAVEIDPILAIRFAVSVIYRASLSRRDNFDQISLGPYLEIAGSLAVDGNFSDLSQPLVMMNVLVSRGLDMRQWAFYPIRCAGDNGLYFVFALSGIQFLVKFGGRNPGVSSGDRGFTDVMRIKADCPVRVCIYPFDESGESQFLRGAMKQNGRGP
jgi:hypothetical protein